MKKKAIVFFADMRTTFDSIYHKSIEDTSQNFIEFAQKISKIAENEGVDVAFLSTVANHKRNEKTMDIDYSGFMEYSWCLSCYVEGVKNSTTGQITTIKNTKLGKSLYKDGYAVLNEEKGFGNYEMTEHSDDTELTQKAINYILELENEYDIDKIFIIDDQVNTLFHKDAALDDEKLKKTLNKPIIKIRPSLPYCTGNSSNTGVDNNGHFYIFSGNCTIGGVNECFDIYLNVLNELEKTKKSKMNVKAMPGPTIIAMGKFDVISKEEKDKIDSNAEDFINNNLIKEKVKAKTRKK